MSPTGTATALGTAEAASLSRAAFSLHLDDPGLDEALQSRFDDAALAALLARGGFSIVARLTERGRSERYLAGRADGWAPGRPLRLLCAGRRA